MIFYWLVKLYAHLRWLFTPPTVRDVARVRRNDPCPVCGTAGGSLRCVERSSVTGTNGVPNTLIVAQHTCKECGARWFESPVVKVDTARVWSAVPRNDIERAEDAIVRSGGYARPAATTNSSTEKVN